MVVVCAPCLATTLTSLAGPTAAVSMAALAQGKKNKPSLKGKKKPPLKKGKKKKPSSKKGKKKPSSKKGKKKKGGSQHGGVCQRCISQECSDCKGQRVEQEEQEYQKYLELFNKEIPKFLNRIQEGTNKPCKKLISLVQEFNVSQENYLERNNKLSDSNRLTHFRKLQEINDIINESYKNCREAGIQKINQLKGKLKNNPKEVLKEIRNKSFYPKICTLCDQKYEEEKKRIDKIVKNRVEEFTPPIPDSIKNTPSRRSSRTRSMSRRGRPDPSSGKPRNTFGDNTIGNLRPEIRKLVLEKCYLQGERTKPKDRKTKKKNKKNKKPKRKKKKEKK